MALCVCGRSGCAQKAFSHATIQKNGHLAEKTEVPLFGKWIPTVLDIFRFS